MARSLWHWFRGGPLRLSLGRGTMPKNTFWRRFRNLRASRHAHGPYNVPSVTNATQANGPSKLTGRTRTCADGDAHLAGGAQPHVSKSTSHHPVVIPIQPRFNTTALATAGTSITEAGSHSSVETLAAVYVTGCQSMVVQSTLMMPPWQSVALSRPSRASSDGM